MPVFGTLCKCGAIYWMGGGQLQLCAQCCVREDAYYYGRICRPLDAALGEPGLATVVDLLVGTDKGARRIMRANALKVFLVGPPLVGRDPHGSLPCLFRPITQDVMVCRQEKIRYEVRTNVMDHVLSFLL